MGKSSVGVYKRVALPLVMLYEFQRAMPAPLCGAMDGFEPEVTRSHKFAPTSGVCVQPVGGKVVPSKLCTILGNTDTRRVLADLVTVTGKAIGSVKTALFCTTLLQGKPFETTWKLTVIVSPIATGPSQMISFWTES